MSQLMRSCALAGMMASMGVPALAQAPSGNYECWFFSSPRGGLNFQLSGSNYVGSDGSRGVLTGSAFKGGANDGVRYQYKGGNPPTFSILGPRGDEVSVCQLAK